MKAWLYILTTGVIFGCGGVATKYAIESGLDPIFGTAVMMTITALGAVPLYLRAGGVDSRGWKMALVAGAVQGGAPALLFNLGFERLPASINTLLISLSPVFAALAAHRFSENDRFNLTKALGLGASVAGVGLLAGSLTAAPSAALLFPLAGAALSGIGFLLVKRVAAQYKPAATLLPMMVGAALVATIITALLNRWQAPSAGLWFIMAILGVTGVAAFGAILAASEIAPASQTALSGYLIPLLGVLGGILVFNEPFGWRLALGGILVLAGVVLVGVRQPTPEPVTIG